MINIVKQDFENNVKIYKRIETELKNKLKEECIISHVGSTAIPNMIGKNIIDILVGAKNKNDFHLLTKEIMEMGYFESENQKDEIYRFFTSNQSETKSGDIHIHLVIIRTERYENFIILKNYLLLNLLAARNYSEFKQNIIQTKTNERKEYKKIKSEYVTNLILEAREYFER